MSAPEKIYLQTDDEGESMDAADFTWCVDQINETDTTYIRADLHAALEQRVELFDKMDTPTAEALAALIFANKVPSPWRDAGIRLQLFGNWLVAVCKEDKALASQEEA